MASRMVTIGRTTLHVRTHGAGRPFLLVHGLSSNASLWDGVAAALAGAGFASHAVDLRSHGLSPATESGYDTGTAAADLAALIEELHLGPVMVAGQSWGGNVAVALAAAHPDLVAALALVDGGWLDLSASFPDWDSCADRLRPPDIEGNSAETIRGYLTSAHPGWAAWAIEATLANLDVRDGRVYRRLSIPHHMQIVRSMWERPPGPDLAAVRCPVALLPAVAADAPADLAAGDTPLAKAMALLGAATLHPYRGGDHDLHAQHPEQVAADLIALAGRVS
jgi:pimeloyl-ACP methyl ester carboxylesterase